MSGEPKTLKFQFIFSILISFPTCSYGHISPATLAAKMFTIGYSLIAIAAMMVMLANVGSGLAGGITYMYR